MKSTYPDSAAIAAAMVAGILIHFVLVAHVVALDKRHLVDYHYHKLLQFNLGSVPFFVLHGGELIAIAKLEGAGESQPTDVGCSSPSEGSLEDIGLLW